MPRLFNDQADEEPLHDGSVSFAGGMVSALRPDQVPKNAVSYALNCIIHDNGEMHTRRGFEQLGSDLSGGGGT